MTNDKSGVWEIGKNSGANAMADENPVNDENKSPHGEPQMRTWQLAVIVFCTITTLAFGQERTEQNSQGQPSQSRASRSPNRGFNFATILKRQDADKDGKLTRDEFRGPKQFFDRVDADKNGIVTADEARQFAKRAGRRGTPNGRAVRDPRQANRQRHRVPENVKAYKNLEYAKAGDKTRSLDLYVPEHSKTTPPLLVWIHGGGWRNGSKERINPMFLRLTGDGYAAASLNYRLNGLEAHPEHTHDCKGAIRWLRAHAEQYGYDASRIGVGGGSAGGHLVLMLGMTADVKELEGNVGGNLNQSSRVQAVVDLYGPSEFPLFAKTSERFRTKHPQSKELWKSASPLSYLSKDDAPVLIFQGDQDHTVPMSQSELLYERYQKAGLESSLHIIRGAGHGGPLFNSQQQFDLVKAFLDKHIRQIKELRK